MSLSLHSRNSQISMPTITTVELSSFIRVFAVLCVDVKFNFKCDFAVIDALCAYGDIVIESCALCTASGSRHCTATTSKSGKTTSPSRPPVVVPSHHAVSPLPSSLRQRYIVKVDEKSAELRSFFSRWLEPTILSYFGQK